jgi:hypothetical protein
MQIIIIFFLNIPRKWQIIQFYKIPLDNILLFLSSKWKFEFTRMNQILEFIFIYKMYI